MNGGSIVARAGGSGAAEDEADQARFDERWDRLAAGTLTAGGGGGAGGPRRRPRRKVEKPTRRSGLSAPIFRPGWWRSRPSWRSAPERRTAPVSSLSAAPLAGLRSGWGPRRPWRRGCSSCCVHPGLPPLPGYDFVGQRLRGRMGIPLARRLPATPGSTLDVEYAREPR